MKTDLMVSVDLTPEVLAKAFAEMGDEEQAQFFIEVARLAAEWGGQYDAGWQWRKVGGHLVTCGCSSEEARSVVLDIAEGIRDAMEPAIDPAIDIGMSSLVHKIKDSVRQ